MIPSAADLAAIVREQLQHLGPERGATGEAALDRLEAELDRLREALELMLLMHERHDRWCGHFADAPGDMIVNVAPDRARAALGGSSE